MSAAYPASALLPATAGQVVGILCGGPSSAPQRAHLNIAVNRTLMNVHPTAELWLVVDSPRAMPEKDRKEFEAVRQPPPMLVPQPHADHWSIPDRFLFQCDSWSHHPTLHKMPLGGGDAKIPVIPQVYGGGLVAVAMAIWLRPAVLLVSGLDFDVNRPIPITSMHQVQSFWSWLMLQADALGVNVRQTNDRSPLQPPSASSPVRPSCG